MACSAAPDGSAVRDYVHVSDLAVIHQRAVEEPITGAFNLGTGRGHSVREVIDTCAKVSGKEIPVRECPRREGDPPVLVASNKKAATELGWQPELSNLDDIIKTAWTWHQKL